MGCYNFVKNIIPRLNCRWSYFTSPVLRVHFKRWLTLSCPARTMVIRKGMNPSSVSCWGTDCGLMLWVTDSLGERKHWIQHFLSCYLVFVFHFLFHSDVSLSFFIILSHFSFFPFLPFIHWINLEKTFWWNFMYNNSWNKRWIFTRQRCLATEIVIGGNGRDRIFQHLTS